jgi:Uma2 family endonuclease
MAQPYLTVVDYLAAERASLDMKHEYIDGVLRPRTLQPLDHVSITVNLLNLLTDALHGTTHWVFSSDMRVQLSPTCFVYPDVSVSLDDSMAAVADNLLTPLVAIEVFTPETVAFDLGQKAHHYRACPTLAEYVLVDCERPFVHVQRRSADGTHWEMRDFRDDEAVELRSLGISIALADIYAIP